MIVCVCHRVSDRDITRAVHEGCDTFEALQDELRCGTNCGRCLDSAQEAFDDARSLAPVIPLALAA
jgi:bacterioferritin-associated ferredoxin